MNNSVRLAQVSRVLAVGLALLIPAAGASLINVDFEAFNDGDILTTQIPGVVFQNLMVVTAGISLNEFDFPPHSGQNAAVNTAGTVIISFPTYPATSFLGFFTYTEQLTIQGFDASNQPVGSVMSAFSDNIACLGTSGGTCPADPGSSPNEVLQLSSPIPFSSVRITGTDAGVGFVVDDLSISIQTPEPSGLLLMAAGGALLAIGRRVTGRFVR